MQEIKTRQKFKKIVGYIKAGTLKKVIIFNERKMIFMKIKHIEKNLKNLILQNGENLRFKNRKAAIAFLNLITGTETCIRTKQMNFEEPNTTEILKFEDNETDTTNRLLITDDFNSLELKFFHGKKFRIWIDEP